MTDRGDEEVKAAQGTIQSFLKRQRRNIVQLNSMPRFFIFFCISAIVCHTLCICVYLWYVRLWIAIFIHDATKLCDCLLLLGTLILERRRRCFAHTTVARQCMWVIKTLLLAGWLVDELRKFSDQETEMKMRRRRINWIVTENEEFYTIKEMFGNL